MSCSCSTLIDPRSEQSLRRESWSGEPPVGSVDHDHPHVVVGQEWAQRAIADEVAKGRLTTAFVGSSNPGA